MPKDAYYFKHDATARDDHKIKALINKYKMIGYAYYWILLEEMRKEKGYKLKIDKKYTLDALAEQMQCTCIQLKEFVKDCVEEFELFVKEDGLLYSESFLERMSKLDEIRQKRSLAAYKSWDNRPHKEDED